MIAFEDFKKLDIKIGTILEAEPVEGSEKLLKLQVDFGSEQRQILSGIAKHYTAEQLKGKQCPFIVNLEPKEIMGMQSQGMMLCADNEGPVILNPEKETPAGSIIR